MRTARSLLACGLSLAVLAFSACGDGESPSTTGADLKLSGSGADELKALALKLDVKTYRATYKVTVTDPAGTTQDFVYGVARKPPASNTSYQSSGVLGATAAIVINDGTNIYNCTQEPANIPFCTTTRATAAQEDNGIFSINTIFGSLDETVDVTPVDGRKIAGIESACFNVKAAGETDGGIGCFSRRDGIVTYLEAKDTDGTRTVFELQTVEDTADDSLFKPPVGYDITPVP